MANPAVDADFQISPDGVYFVTLASIKIPNPHPVWKEGVQKVKLGDNSARVLGAPVLEWHWGFLSQEQRDTLRAYCPGASADIFIWTPTTEKVAGVSNAAVEYETQMWWPSPDTPEDPNTGRRLDFVLTFKQLVAQ